jgi:CRP-like cAMP-binding protein
MTDSISLQLRNVMSLSGLSDDTVARLEPLIHRAQAQAGDILVREGTLDRRAFVILDGTAEVFCDGEILARRGPGSIVGELGALEGRPRSTTVRAAAAMSLLVISDEAVERLAQHPPFVLSLADLPTLPSAAAAPTR